jgi:hypothetical protein
MSHLHKVGEVRDASGMASTALAEAIAYPGSSIAFAQLLSGMERSGLIEREVRGKRTYRITLQAAVKPASSRAGSSRAGSSHAGSSHAEPSRTGKPVAVGKSDGRTVAGETADDFDYDELARRLLLQVVQRLGASPGQGPEAVEDAGAGGPGDSGASLARTVASLEHKLASATSQQRRLTQENAKLREQLRAAQESLAQERAGADRIAGRLDSAEVRLLERLLSPLRDKGARHEEADAG